MPLDTPDGSLRLEPADVVSATRSCAIALIKVRDYIGALPAPSQWRGCFMPLDTSVPRPCRVSVVSTVTDCSYYACADVQHHHVERPVIRVQSALTT
jgi:hypothetical protein